MNSVYIIYSPSIDKYYIGETEDLISRLAQHNEHTFKGSYTAKASDWGLVWSQQFENRSIARKIEMFLKNQKSKQFIIRFINSKELQTSILSKY